MKQLYVKADIDSESRVGIRPLIITVFPKTYLLFKLVTDPLLAESDEKSLGFHELIILFARIFLESELSFVPDIAGLQ